MTTPATTKQFIKHPRDLLESEAWRGLGINGRRVIDFLELEHLRKGGKKNGELKAPYRQLVAAGVGARYVAETIADLERRGLIACHRAGNRIATTYTLTWIGLPGGKMPEEGWRTYRDPDLRPTPRTKSRNLHHKGNADAEKSASQRECSGPNLHHKGNADAAENCITKGMRYIEKTSSQGELYTRYREEAEPVVVPLRPAVEGGR